MYHQVSSDDELHLLLHASHSIYNLVISQQKNGKCKHSSYGKFYHVLRNTKHQNCEPEASMNFANPNYEP